MKTRKVLVAALAAVMFASCSKMDNEDIQAPSSSSVDNAYLSISLNTATPGTYADAGPGTSDGTDESAIKKVYVIGFDEAEENVLGVYQLSAGEGTLGTVGTSTVTALAGTAIKVNKDIKKIFVVVNPSPEASKQISEATTTYDGLNRVIAENVSDLTNAAGTGFMMTSAGTAPDDKGLVAANVQVAASESASDIQQAQDDAKDAPAVVNVDRVAAKVTLATYAGTTLNGTASISNWELNTTNKTYLPYAELVSYTLDGTATSGIGKYRKDNNYDYADKEATIADYKKNFIWLTNAANTTTWAAAGASRYCLENTMGLFTDGTSSSNYNNSTKLTIAAKFTPTGITNGTSWFRIGGNIFDLAQLQAYYAAATTPAATKNFIEEWYTFMSGKATAAGQGFTSTGIADVTIAELDAVPNGGYESATFTDTKGSSALIQYYQQSVCYYEVTLKHDNRVQAKMLGRWGVVRNNSYTVNITKISKPGTPFIPDPTDPGIVDPTNPDPDQPKPSEESSAYMSVSITVNPWTTWSQDVEL